MRIPSAESLRVLQEGSSSGGESVLSLVHHQGGVGDGWPVDIPALRAHVTSDGGTRREGHRTTVGGSCSRSGSVTAGKSVVTYGPGPGGSAGSHPSQRAGQSAQKSL